MSRKFVPISFKSQALQNRNTTMAPATYDAESGVCYDSSAQSPRQTLYSPYETSNYGWLPPTKASQSDAILAYAHGMGSWEAVLLAVGCADGAFVPGSIESDYDYEGLSKGNRSRLSSYEVDPSIDGDTYADDFACTDEWLPDLEGKAYTPQDLL